VYMSCAKGCPALLTSDEDRHQTLRSRVASAPPDAPAKENPSDRTLYMREYMRRRRATEKLNAKLAEQLWRSRT
jgi:hypothetical protein